MIINKGKLVATDSVRNLQARARGAESVRVEVAGRNGALKPRWFSTSWSRLPGSAEFCTKSSWMGAQSSKSRAAKDACFEETSRAPSLSLVGT